MCRRRRQLAQAFLQARVQHVAFASWQQLTLSLQAGRGQAWDLYQSTRTMVLASAFQAWQDSIAYHQHLRAVAGAVAAATRVRLLTDCFLAWFAHSAKLRLAIASSRRAQQRRDLSALSSAFQAWHEVCFSSLGLKHAASVFARRCHRVLLQQTFRAWMGLLVWQPFNAIGSRQGQQSVTGQGGRQGGIRGKQAGAIQHQSRLLLQKAWSGWQAHVQKGQRLMWVTCKVMQLSERGLQYRVLQLWRAWADFKDCQAMQMQMDVLQRCMRQVLASWRQAVRGNTRRVLLLRTARSLLVKLRLRQALTKWRQIIKRTRSQEAQADALRNAVLATKALLGWQSAHAARKALTSAADGLQMRILKRMGSTALWAWIRYAAVHRSASLQGAGVKSRLFRLRFLRWRALIVGGTLQRQLLQLMLKRRRRSIIMHVLHGWRDAVMSHAVLDQAVNVAHQWLGHSGRSTTAIYEDSQGAWFDWSMQGSAIQNAQASVHGVHAELAELAAAFSPLHAAMVHVTLFVAARMRRTVLGVLHAWRLHVEERIQQARSMQRADAYHIRTCRAGALTALSRHCMTACKARTEAAAMQIRACRRIARRAILAWQACVLQRRRYRRVCAVLLKLRAWRTKAHVLRILAGLAIRRRAQAHRIVWMRAQAASNLTSHAWQGWCTQVAMKHAANAAAGQCVARGRLQYMAGGGWLSCMMLF